MAQSPCILIVDDESEIRTMLKMMLERAGFQTEEAENGLQAVRRCQAEPPPDLVVMDVAMPVMDGIEACRCIRAFSTLPVILLTVCDEEETLLAGFGAGAYDFLTKPFRPRELLARVNALLERARPARQPEAALPAVKENSSLRYADLVLDPRRHEVRRGGATLNITASGFHLLMYFMSRPGEVITKESLLRDVWGCTGEKDNMVEAAIKRLRKELGDDPRHPRYIKTVWGVGYRFGE